MRCGFRRSKVPSHRRGRINLPFGAPRLGRQIPRHPFLEAAVEDVHPVEALPYQDPRQTGAGGFAGSGAVEDEIAVPREVVDETMERGRAKTERSLDHPIGLVVIFSYNFV